jgi:hypothetical protein
MKRRLCALVSALQNGCSSQLSRFQQRIMPSPRSIAFLVCFRLLFNGRLYHQVYVLWLLDLGLKRTQFSALMQRLGGTAQSKTNSYIM